MRKNNMAKTLKFVYGLVLFLYLFLIEKGVDGKTFLMAEYIKCDTDADCPIVIHHSFYKCIDNLCKRFRRQKHLV
ncbi:putative Late nodulin [Medicago truncatula]|nr:unknown [Medicago truncatula]RHN51344.1 putative Late nodulin [Medicago truncatula]